MVTQQATTATALSDRLSIRLLRVDHTYMYLFPVHMQAGGYVHMMDS
jgi:hypothetical protein